MLLGQKIRKIRISQTMTQAELSGNFITRNMLSQIENGTAMPSIQTIQYLAKKLNVPAGYFLTEEDDDFGYKKMQIIAEMKQKYAEKEYTQCIALYEQYLQRADDELHLILAECNFNLAMILYQQGKLYSAKTKFLQSLQHADQTIYPTDSLRTITTLFLDFIHSMDSGLKVELPTPYLTLVENSVRFNCYLYRNSLQLLEENLTLVVENRINLPFFVNEIYKEHLMAKILMKQNKENEAKKKMEMILHRYTETEIGVIVLYQIYNDLEICCENGKDYENAYHYSSKKIALLQIMRE